MADDKALRITRGELAELIALVPVWRDTVARNPRLTPPVKEAVLGALHDAIGAVAARAGIKERVPPTDVGRFWEYTLPDDPEPLFMRDAESRWRVNADGVLGMLMTNQEGESVWVPIGHLDPA